MDDTIHRLAILYADVSGSTHIYEKHGDKVARENIETCIEILSRVASDMDGRVVKTIGDEVMCAFPNPVKAAMAASEMHQSLRDASEMDRFSIGAIHVKIGWHYGEVSYRGKEIIGEAPITAQQVIKLAKADEILISEQSLGELPEELKSNARFIDCVEAEGYEGELNVYGLPWEEEEAVTKIGSASNYDDVSKHKALILEYQGKSICLDSEHTHCHIGRGTENDLCVDGKFTSRLHAEIVFMHGIFHLRDVSTNGTALIFSDGRSTRLHREEAILSDQGTICFGGLPENDPAAAVHFECQYIDD